MDKILKDLPLEHFDNISLIYIFGENKLYKTNDDIVYGIGRNYFGELGFGHTERVLKPTVIHELCNKQINDFRFGTAHCIALSDDGKLFSFGSNQFNQLGYETKGESISKPRIIESLLTHKVTQISCGSRHTIILTEEGDVYGWGHNSDGQIGNNSLEVTQIFPHKLQGFSDKKISSISCGSHHSMALTVKGNAFGWGCNDFGQLGINSTVESRFPKPIEWKNKDSITKISCGQNHSLFLTENEEIYSCGDQVMNQSVLKTSENFQSIPFLINKNFKSSEICCVWNSDISTALSSTDNFCYFWGKSEYKYPIKSIFKCLKDYFLELKGIMSSPLSLKDKNLKIRDKPIVSYLKIPKTSQFESRKDLFKSHLIITNDDIVYGFGTNINGELGLGHSRYVIEPTIIPELCIKHIIEIIYGQFHSIARSIDGKLYSFGSNACNQLGYETEKKYDNSPKIIESLINKTVIQVSCGGNHTIVFTQDGQVFGWGHNDYGQIGINSKEEFISIPTKIIGFNGEKIQTISCGSSYSMALTLNGNVFSWGCNMWGQLGINSFDDSFIPQMIKIENKILLFKKISCGLSHSLLLSTNGDIYSFGSNAYNQLGYETHKVYYSTIPRMIETKPVMHFSDICCHFNDNISTALSSTEGICYIWGECRNQVIKSLEKTKYKNCEEAIFHITDNSFRAFNFESDLKVSNNFFDKNYSDIKIISKGIFAQVFKCKNIKTKELSAVKRIEINVKEILKIIREREMMSQLKNESLVGYKQSWIESNDNKQYFLYIEMELCLKTLSELKKQMFKELNCKTSICESIIGLHIMSELIKEVIEGLDYLHKNNIIHRDIKTKNIMINDYNINGKYIRICDFGLSRIHDCEDQSLTANVGTFKYMAPELKQSSGRLLYTNKVDIYSLGIVIEEVFDFDKQNFDIKEIIWGKIENIIRMQNMMVSINPKMRPNCEQLLKKSNEWLIRVNELEVKRILQKSVKSKSMNHNFYIYFLSKKDLLYKEMNLNKILETEKHTKYANKMNINLELINSFTKQNYFENHFKEIEIIAKGYFGSVFKAINIDNKLSFAIKRVTLNPSISAFWKHLKEIQIMSQLNCSFIVEYINSWIEKKEDLKNDELFLYIQMELCEQNLNQLNQQLLQDLNCKQSICETRIGFQIISQIMVEMIEGVNYLHKNNLIHRDLKPSNILTTNLEKGRIIKICDFGLICIHDNENDGHTGNVGTAKYMAPELSRSIEANERIIYDFKVDIYSLGVIFEELFEH